MSLCISFVYILKHLTLKHLLMKQYTPTIPLFNKKTGQYVNVALHRNVPEKTTLIISFSNISIDIMYKYISKCIDISENEIIC